MTNNQLRELGEIASEIIGLKSQPLPILSIEFKYNRVSSNLLTTFAFT